jgi:hypothetical protein
MAASLPSVQAPASDGQITYAGLTLGAGTPYRITAVSGWQDMPGLDSGNVPRAGQPGSYAGDLLAQTRIVEVDLTIRAGAGSISDAVAALRAATAIRQSGDDEAPLVLALADEPLYVLARPIRRAIPMDPTYRVGVISGVAIQFEATDPRRYPVGDTGAGSTGLPVIAGGLVWPLTWPLDWGDAGSTGQLTVTNIGDAPASPVLTVRGLLGAPWSVTLVETGQTLVYDLPLAATDAVEIDTWQGTVTLNGSADRAYTATAGSEIEQAFMIPPGSYTLAFRASSGDPSALLSVSRVTAYW